VLFEVVVFPIIVLNSHSSPLLSFLLTFRWSIVHISFVYHVREMFSKNNIGPMPPPILSLSDGGHFENLAILPLFKRRLPKIVVVDGGYKHDRNLYGDSLLHALMLARIKLNCSFVSDEGHDVISDLLQTFVRPQAGGNQRYFKFVATFSFYSPSCILFSIFH